MHTVCVPRLLCVCLYRLDRHYESAHEQTCNNTEHHLRTQGVNARDLNHGMYHRG